MTALNETGTLWSTGLAELIGALASPAEGDPEEPGPACCWFIDICCWVVC